MGWNPVKSDKSGKTGYITGKAKKGDAGAVWAESTKAAIQGPAYFNGGFKGAGGKVFGEMNKLAGLDDGDVAGTIDIGNNFEDPIKKGDFAIQQKHLVKMLQDQAAGRGPSMANMVADQQRQQGLNQLLAQQASMRGANPAMMARTQQMAGSNLSSQIAQQAMQGRLAEQQASQSNLGNALTSFRGQDNDYTKMQADFQTAIGQAKTQAEMEKRRLNAEADMQVRKGRQEQFSNTRKVGQGVGSGMAGGGMSDERVKHNISNISKADVVEFFKAVEPKKYEYNSPGTYGQREGERIGFMLQDVQNTKIGKSIIHKDANGHMSYDLHNLVGVLMVAMSTIVKG